jgi:preprotein translocase subunit SecE
MEDAGFGVKGRFGSTRPRHPASTIRTEDAAANCEDRVGAFVQELFRFGLYKRSQGRIARQVTFASLAVIFALGAWCLSDYYSNRGPVPQFVIPMLVLVVGLWASFRVVQLPSFADFLISVEAEMNKVSWPTRSELFRSSIVVMLMIFILAFVLLLFDLMWKFLLGRLLS